MVIHGCTASRERSLAYYSSQVDLWEAGGMKQEFLGIDVTLSPDHLLNSTQEEGQSHEPRTNSPLPPYTSVFYSIFAEGATFGIERQETYDPHAQLNITLLVKEGEMNSRIFLRHLPIFREVLGVSRDRAFCELRKGYFRQSTSECIFYERLQQMCLKISRANDQWALNSTWDSQGCILQEDGKLSQYRYQQIQMLPNQSIDFAFPMDWPHFKLTVRSGHDPILYAQVLTEGTYDFGKQSKTLVVSGAVLMITMLMLMVRPLVVVCKAYRRSGGCKELCRPPPEPQRMNHYRIEDDQDPDY